MADGLVVIDADGRVLVYSPPAEGLLGLAPGRLAVGERLEELAPLPALLAAVSERRDGSAPLEPVLEIGPQRTVYAELTRLPPAAAGGAASVLIVLRDARDAEQLQSMRRDFMANVSHEMRTPLAAIRGASATLLAGALGNGEQARHFVAVIEQHAVRLGQVLEDVGCLADLEHGEVPLQRRPLAVAKALSTAVRACRDAALGGGVGLDWTVAADTPPLDGDRDLLDQVLQRLIDNAVRYTPRGGRVTVSAGATAAPDGASGGWIRLVVVDTGVGIAPADVPRLSERFYRPDKSRSREHGGSGLGLAVVKHIVRAHGGVMEIASALEQGTAVTLLWPAASVELAVADAAAADAVVADAAVAEQGGER